MRCSNAPRSIRVQTWMPPAGRRSALDISRDSYLWARPLADPVGGTSANGGRHPAKMSEPETGSRCTR